MHSNLKKLLVEKHEAVVTFCTGLETVLVFAVGLGRYRTVLVFGFFFMLRAFFKWAAREERILLILLLPALSTSLYYDFTRGQIFPVLPYGNALIAVASLVIADALFVRLFLSRVLQKWSGMALFKVCPVCNYDNKSLVNSCLYCSYSKNDAEESYVAGDKPVEDPHIGRDLIDEIAEYKKAGFKRPSRKIMNLISLSANEHLLIHMRLFPYVSYFKDGVRLLAGNLLITTRQIIFVHSLFFERGWRMREAITYDDITRLLMTTHRVVTTDEPAIVIETSEGSYEIVFKSILPYGEKIDNIVRCIKRRRSGVKIESGASNRTS